MHAIGVQIERLVEDLGGLLGCRLSGASLSTIQWLRHVELPNQLYIRICSKLVIVGRRQHIL